MPYPDALLTDEQGSTLYKQLACHARYTYELPDGSHTSHESWDLEAWRRDVSWSFAMNPLMVPFHQCNW
ncbi:DUF2599 domain-containing protein [Streptomyces platensis]|uniref:DUF2599 domain-containing protein n=1 Tax=Streptomyces platensis TaxID=58346 RepID=UPI003327CC16